MGKKKGGFINNTRSIQQIKNKLLETLKKLPDDIKKKYIDSSWLGLKNELTPDGENILSNILKNNTTDITIMVNDELIKSGIKIGIDVTKPPDSYKPAYQPSHETDSYSTPHSDSYSAPHSTPFAPHSAPPFAPETAQYAHNVDDEDASQYAHETAPYAHNADQYAHNANYNEDDDDDDDDENFENGVPAAGGRSRRSRRSRKSRKGGKGKKSRKGKKGRKGRKSRKSRKL